MKSLRLTFSFISIFLITAQSFGQETLQEKYDALIKETETFQQYKVIPRKSLDTFWSETMDSVKRTNQQVKDLHVNLASQKDSIQKFSAKIDELQGKLDESLNMNDSISLLGIPFSKLGYHVLVWSIIVVLSVLGFLAYFLFIRSNKQTSKFRKELESLKTEFEEQKVKSLEKQLKLKRELQTAVNQLSERRN